MIHPSDLLRSDSRSKEFAAPLHLQGKAENDWGISILPCLAKVFTWRSFAKPSVFIVILSLIGCIQGLLLYYFRNTSDIWTRQYDIARDITGWIIYINEFFVGVLALPITYWATVTHRVIWISVLTICHGISAISLMLSEIFLSKSVQITNSTVHLCGALNQEPDKYTNYIAASVMVVYQLFSAASSIAFYSLGLVYIDDNAPRNKSVVLAIALASRQVGQQLGIYTSWIPRYFKIQHIFGGFIWLGISVAYILVGISIAMFPKMLPDVLIKKLAASLLEIASGISLNDVSKPNSEGFLSSLGRIFKNKIVILSIISTVTIQTALINFWIFESYFKQSRFFLSDNFDKSGYNNSFSLNFTTNLLEQPLIVLCTLVTGYVLTRSRIRIKYLVLWNLIMFTLATLLFSSYLFIRCEHVEMTKLVPSCSVDCGCSLEGTFNPVCLTGRTYYSPCHAGCTTMDQMDDYQFYKNCSCASFEGVASDGSCHADKCDMMYQLSQVNNVIAGGFLATTVVTNLVIIFNSVKKRDKSMAIALEITLLSLVPFLPVKTLYQYIADRLCRYRYHEKCRIYSEDFSVFLSNTTVILMIVGSLVQMFLLWVCRREPHMKLNLPRNDSMGEVTSWEGMIEVEHQNMEISRIANEIESLHSEVPSSVDLNSFCDDHDPDEDMNFKTNYKDSSSILESHF